MISKPLKPARMSSGLSLKQLEHRIGKWVTALALGTSMRDEMMPISGVPMASADQCHYKDRGSQPKAINCLLQTGRLSCGDKSPTTNGPPLV